MATVASVYAKALFEFGQEKGQLDTVFSELKSFWETCLGHDALRAVLAEAGINPNDRKAVLDATVKAAGLGPVTARFLNILVSRGRLGELPGILRHLEVLIEGSQGILSGVARTAVELSSDELGVLASALAKRVGGKVRLSQVVDPSLLGGVVATVAGKTFDASLRTQIERFKNELV